MFSFKSLKRTGEYHKKRGNSCYFHVLKEFLNSENILSTTFQPKTRRWKRNYAKKLSTDNGRLKSRVLKKKRRKTVVFKHQFLSSLSQRAQKRKVFNPLMGSRLNIWLRTLFHACTEITNKHHQQCMTVN